MEQEALGLNMAYTPKIPANMPFIIYISFTWWEEMIIKSNGNHSKRIFYGGNMVMMHWNAAILRPLHFSTASKGPDQELQLHLLPNLLWRDRETSPKHERFSENPQTIPLIDVTWLHRRCLHICRPLGSLRTSLTSEPWTIWTLPCHILGYRKQVGPTPGTADDTAWEFELWTWLETIDVVANGHRCPGQHKNEVPNVDENVEDIS